MMLCGWEERYGSLPLRLWAPLMNSWQFVKAALYKPTQQPVKSARALHGPCWSQLDGPSGRADGSSPALYGPCSAGAKWTGPIRRPVGSAHVVQPSVKTMLVYCHSLSYCLSLHSGQHLAVYRVPASGFWLYCATRYVCMTGLFCSWPISVNFFLNYWEIALSARKLRNAAWRCSCLQCADTLYKFTFSFHNITAFIVPHEI